jgi:2-polyprenyl-6-methoxyphenol hydroxylase-like FAD-dependent oxidoreductase
VPYDLIVVGGGLAGSSLAIVMARHGASVLVLEREERFRDRIRGEAIHVWGTVEARSLGLYEPLLERCAHELCSATQYLDSVAGTPRDLVETTPSHGKILTFYHPEMQEFLITSARAAGASVWRGARVTGVLPGEPPQVVVQHDGLQHQVAARLVVGADGRRSAVRTWGGFAVRRDPDDLRIAGVLVSNIPADNTSLSVFKRSEEAWNTQFIPLGQQRYRAYFVSGDRERHVRIGGAAGLTHFLAYARDSGVPSEWLETIHFDGPLASFEAASSWVEHPYHDGLTLIGDAAAAADPCFGNGQSLALRDVRVLSQHLLAEADWAAAADHYAEEHDASFGSLHRLERWYAEAWLSTAPDKQHVREHALAAGQRGDGPDNTGRGPDQPSDDAARMRFLGY